MVIALAVAAPLGLAGSAVAQAAPSVAPSAEAGPAASIQPFAEGATRLSGASRYETAVAVSQRYLPGVKAAFVASGANFPDALSAAAAAASLGGPLLLTQPTQVPRAVVDELARLKPAAIYLVGGTGVVSTQVQKTLSDIAPTQRLSGADRYATAQAVVGTVFAAGAGEAVIASGRDFPDAVGATGVAGARHAPIILLDGQSSHVPASTSALIAGLGVTKVRLAGGTGAVSAAIQTQLENAGIAVTRYGGASRYETSALLNADAFPAGSSTTAFIASGSDFPDALAAGALAGALGAPLALSTRTCVVPAVGDQLATVGATSTVVLGGTAVLAESVARVARCVAPTVTEPLADWATTGWTPKTDVAAPYADRPLVDVNSPSIKLDSTGLLIYSRLDNGARADHPVAYAQYGISALLEYQRTGKTLWLDRAKRQGERLIQMHTESRGAWWYPYNFPWTYYSRTLTAPWWSGMAQGQVLSLFVRLADATGDAKWDAAADKTFASFTLPYSATAPWSSLVIDKHLYIEEYAGNQPPLLVLNGHVFALFGLYDYWKRTGNATAASYFDGGATTVLERMMPLVRVEGGVSYYCVQYDYCQTPGWQNGNYHPIHSWQLDTLTRLTGDDAFSTWATQLRSDWTPGTPRPFSGNGGVEPKPAPDQAPDLGTW